MSKVKSLSDRGLISPNPAYVVNTCYEVIVGSFAYGVSSDTSDVDIYAVTVPPKGVVFPHTLGHIQGFDNPPNTFNVYQEHHIQDDKSEYDLAIYSIVKYFQLCADNNPNMLDSLFVPPRCITHIDNVGRIILENRNEFVHRGCYHKFKGYAHNQMHKVRTKNPIGKRKALVEEFGYDVKFAYHTVRLLLECRQLLLEGEMNLEINSEVLKEIRRGEWTIERLEEWFKTTCTQLDELYLTSTIQLKPNMGNLRNILMTCLEEHYGTIADVNFTDNRIISKWNQIRQIVNS